MTLRLQTPDKHCRKQLCVPAAHLPEITCTALPSSTNLSLASSKLVAAEAAIRAKSAHMYSTRCRITC